MTLRLGAQTPTLRLGGQTVSKAYRGGTEVFSASIGVGGLLSVEIGADGWYADLTFKGQATGGTYDLGLGANGNPDTGTPKFTLTVTSLGFDDAGLPTTLTRTVYGTKRVRKPYPSNAQAQETVFGTADVTVRVALSSHVFAKDKSGAGNSGTDVAVSVGAGLYTVGGVASLGGSLTATNSSTVAYPKVVGNWSYPGGDKAGATIATRMVGFHASGRLGRPLRAVKFTATGVTSGAVVEQTVTAMTVDGALGDANPVPEYAASLSTATLTQAEKVTLRFQAFPWIGDAASVLDTSAGTAGPTPYYGPISVVCDKAGTYNNAYAVVDSVSGNDSTGTARTGTVDGTLPFLTIAAAYNALRTLSNSTYGRNNTGGATIYLRTGSHAWPSSTAPTVSTTGLTASDSWTTVTRFPGDPRAGVVVNSGGGTGTRTLGSMLRLRDITWTAQSGTGVVNGFQYLWQDALDINCPTANQPPFYAGTGVAVAAVQYATRCTVTAFATGFTPFAANAPWAVVRGNTITACGVSRVYMVLGNRRAAYSGMADIVFHDQAATNLPVITNSVFAYNWISSPVTSNSILQQRMGVLVESHGLAVVQNVFEATTNGSPSMVSIAADGSTGDPGNNALLWHNTLVGQRGNIGYNDGASAAPSRKLWSVKNNVADDLNIKTDVFGNNSAAIQNWPNMWGVGYSGNLDGEVVGIGAPGQFVWEFFGLSSVQPPANALTMTSATNTAAYMGFTSRGSYTGSAAGAGNGDYHLASGPGKALARDWLLPFDLGGAARTATSDSGAYAAAA